MSNIVVFLEELSYSLILFRSVFHVYLLYVDLSTESANCPTTTITTRKRSLSKCQVTVKDAVHPLHNTRSNFKHILLLCESFERKACQINSLVSAIICKKLTDSTSNAWCLLQAMPGETSAKHHISKFGVETNNAVLSIED